MALAVLDEISHAFGHHPLIDRASLQIELRDGWRIEGRYGMVLSPLGLKADVHVETESGAW
jgi:hypothetical protein